MTDPIREALERLHHYSYMCPMHDTDEIVAAARATLAAPAAPLKERPDFIAGYREGLADGRRIVEHEDTARAALDATPPAPAAGEVGELVAWLLEEAVQAANSDASYSAGMLTWAAQVVGEHAALASDGPAVPEGREPASVAPEVSDGDVEVVAQIIYRSMRFDRLGSTSDWATGGNSLAQDEARRCARALPIPQQEES